MSLYKKLGVFLLLVTLWPLAAAGFGILRIAETALRERIVDAQQTAARAEALRVAGFVAQRVEALRRAATTFDLSTVTASERADAARFVFRADDAVGVALLVDDAGTAVARPAFVPPDADASGLEGHPRATEDDAAALLKHAPLADAVREGAGAVVLSDAYLTPRGDAALAVLLTVRAPAGRVFVFVVEVSLAALAVPREHGREIVVVDAAGRIVAAPERVRLTQVDRRVALLPARPGAGSAVVTLDGARDVVAHAPVPMEGIGWQVLASVSEREAFAPVTQMRTSLLASLAVVLTLLAGASLYFVRGVRRALSAVVGGAEAFAKGKLEHKIDPLPEERELKELADTFNRMGDELLHARGKLLTWNEELERTVDVRTRELKEAQAKLLETRKLAAVGQLGAGVAHEINNPLAAVLGATQNMIAKKKKAGLADDDPELVSLYKVERSAKRCRDITTTLLRFSQRSAEKKREPVPLARVVEDAIAMTRANFEGAGHTLSAVHADPALTVLGDVGELVQVVVHLLNNAHTAIAGRSASAVEVRTEAGPDGARIVVVDRGKGIDPTIKERIFEPFFTTKDVWQNLGLGLSESFRIVEDHTGRIEVQSEVGVGTTVTVVLPIAAGGAP